MFFTVLVDVNLVLDEAVDAEQVQFGTCTQISGGVGAALSSKCSMYRLAAKGKMM